VKPFKFEQATTAVQASQTHVDAAPNARFIAGGTDILGEIKEGILEVNILVSLAGLSGASEIISSDVGLEIGALVTLARIASDQSIVETYPALAQARRQNQWRLLRFATSEHWAATFARGRGAGTIAAHYSTA